MSVTRNVPPPALNDLAMELGQDGIRRILRLMSDAYHGLRARGIITATMQEDEITEEWVVDIKLRWRQEPNIQLVPIQQKRDAYKAKRRGKAPTIDFCFRDRLFPESYFGAECKLLDEGSNTYLKAYLDEEEGIGRYLSGKYAASTGAGAMIGYVRTGDPKAVARELAPGIKALHGAPEFKASQPLPDFDDLYESTHKRTDGVSPFQCFHMLLGFYCDAA